MSANTYQKSLIRENSSAVAYEALTFTAGEYIPVNNQVFSGIYVAPGTTNGNIKIVGVDGESKVLTLGPGVWPFGGIKILENGTTISTAAVTILF